MGDEPQNPDPEGERSGTPLNPFGDMSELMRMLQSPDFQRMLQSPGPVNMEIARNTADDVAALDVEREQKVPEPAIEPASIAAFDDVVRAVQLVVSETTGISAVLTVPSECVNRGGWSRATLAGLEPVLTSLATALGRAADTPGTDPEPVAGAESFMGMSPDVFFGMMMQQIMPPVLGGWAGSMIGFLSHNALGQYDLPLPLAGAPKLLFVVRNADAFSEEWELPIDELRYALALREVVHGAQRAVPWVRELLVRLASDFVGAYEVQTTAIEDLFSGLDLNDPSSMESLEQLSDPNLLLGAMRTDAQTPRLEALQRFVSVLEGYTDVIVESLGERMVPADGRIDEALRRHRLDRGDATAFVDRLLGLELDRGHYDAGVAFCRGVMERSEGGFEQLNRLWEREAMVPTESELAAPGLWLARIDLPDDL